VSAAGRRERPAAYPLFVPSCAFLRAALVALLLAAGAAGSGRAATLPSIYVDYSDACTFTMRADGGITLTTAAAPGTTVPPGLYQVVLTAPKNAPSCPMDFKLVGPGVDLEWTFGGEALDAMATETFVPSATYVATDIGNASRGLVVFSTTATGSSSSLVTQMPGTATGKGVTLPGVVGSALLPFRGTVLVSLPHTGAFAVTSRGRRVTTLQPGWYRLVVIDTSTARGLAEVSRSGARTVLTAGGYTGRRTLTLALTAGTALAGGAGARVVVRSG
jgi:hypothetical protein